MLFVKLITSLIIGLICGFLGAWGGASGTTLGWRRIVMPVVLSVFGILVNWSLWFILVMLYVLPLTQGYGMPCFIVGYEDEGSTLGKFWYNLLKKEKLANIVTRGTIGLMEALVFIWIPIIKHNWLIYSICALGIISTNAIIGGFDLRFHKNHTFKFLKKDLLYNELYIYLANGIFICVMLIF